MLVISLDFAYASETLRYGQELSSGGKIVKVDRIASGKAIFSVGDESKVISVGKEDEISGVKIKVIEVFYVPEQEDRYVIVEMSVKPAVCGDNICEGSENCDSCEADCACGSGERCRDGKCISSADECFSNNECDDDKDETVDVCRGSPRKCYNEIFNICDKDEDCDDGNECTKDVCVESDCVYNKIENCVEEVSVNEEGESSKGGEGIVFEKKTNKFIKLIQFIISLFKRG